MADNSAKGLCRIRSLTLTQSLNVPDECDRTKPTKASRTRSVSPPHTKAFDWEEFCRIDEVDEDDLDENGVGTAKKPWRWSLKEFLVRSISEGRGRTRQKEMEREMLVQAALRADKKKKKKPTSTSNRLGDYNSKKLGDRSPAISKKLSPLESAMPHPRCTNEKACKVQRHCAVSAHERYYWANRARAQAEAEQLKKKTFLPYRKGLLGFLGPFQSSNSGTHHVPLSAS